MRPAFDIWANLLRSPWAIVIVLGVAAALRFWMLGEWSLWEDEETTIFFSQNPDKPFPSLFPIFFFLLGQLFDLTGISPGTARLIPALAGILSVWLVYTGFGKLFSREVGLLAALFVAVGLGHLFWSQSVRYFTLVLALEVLAIYWFARGFESGRVRDLVLSNIAFALAVFSHQSALLLVPALFAYLFVMVWLRPGVGAYSLKGYLAYLVPLALVVAGFVSGVLRQLALQGSLGDSGGVIASARDPVQYLLRVVAYFGLPVIVLGLFAPVLAARAAGRLVFLLVCIALVPVAELVTITFINQHTNFINATWYYGFVSLVGFSVLAAITLTRLFEHGWKRTAAILLAGSCAYYAVFLGGYYTTMHGDRPRWEEAAALVKETASIDPARGRNPAIFATVPGVVAFYLGVPPSVTMGHPLVRPVPRTPLLTMGAGETWYLMKVAALSPAHRVWLQEHCELVRTFESFTGPADRSISVHRCPPRSF